LVSAFITEHVEVDAGPGHADEPVRKALPDVVRADGLLRRPLENCPGLGLEAALVANCALPEATTAALLAGTALVPLGRRR
jgi:hypothetical protein